MKASGGELGWLTSPNEEGVSRLIKNFTFSSRGIYHSQRPNLPVVRVEYGLWSCYVFFKKFFIFNKTLLIVLSGGKFSVLL